MDIGKSYKKQSVYYNMKRGLNKEIFFLLVYPIIATIISFIFHANFFFSVILFLALPSIYLSFKGEKYVPRLLIFSFFASIPLIIILDYIGQASGTWSFPPSIISYKLFSVVSLETILWAFFNVYYVVIFYEYFLDKHVTKKIWNPHMKYLIIFLLIIIIPFTLFLIYLPSSIHIPYFYLVFGLVIFIFPILWQLFYHPSVLSKIFKTGAYFFYLSLVYEFAAIKLGWWFFPGLEYIGWITIFSITFPLEELIFWVILFAMAVAAAFEFLDNEKLRK